MTSRQRTAPPQMPKSKPRQPGRERRHVEANLTLTERNHLRMSTTLSAQDLRALHEATLDMYRLRAASIAAAHGTEFTPEMCESLAQMMDMCAAERVLDEADYATMPGWDHPATREVRKRLMLAEEMIAALITVPARLRAAMTAGGQTPLWQLSMLDNMDTAMEQATHGLALTGVSDFAAMGRVRVIDEIVEDLHERAFVASIEQQDAAGLAVSHALVEAADALCDKRAATFMRVEHHAQVTEDVDLMI